MSGRRFASTGTHPLFGAGVRDIDATPASSRQARRAQAALAKRKARKVGCRRCSECEGENHHWIEHCDDPAEVGENAFVGYVCKHCDARVEMCDSCDGPDEPGHSCLDELEDVEQPRRGGA